MVAVSHTGMGPTSPRFSMTLFIPLSQECDEYILQIRKSSYTAQGHALGSRNEELGTRDCTRSVTDPQSRHHGIFRLGLGGWLGEEPSTA